jgi:outer membrane protein OmpA-like peptidoglycan-associated protein
LFSAEAGCMKKLLLLIFMFAVSVKLFPQKKLYSKSIEEGNYLFLEKNYIMALQSYEQAYSIDSTNANINYKMGVCYLNLPSKKKKSLRYLDKAVRDITKNYDEDEPGVKHAPMDAIYYHAKALHFNSMFTEAMAEFEKYNRIAGTKNKERHEEILRQIEMCKNAIEFSKNPSNVIIKNLGDSVNTEYPDYSPVVNADESLMLFTSRRPGSTGGERGVDGSYYEDIYSSHRKSDGTWATAQKLFSLINTNSNEATIGLSPDGQMVYVYKDSNGGDLFFSTLTGEIWSDLTPFGPEVNSPHWETHISISPDGNSMFFSSDRPGGFGGQDLYRCVKLPTGKWSDPQNLGASINTKYDEDSPYLHPDGKKLFFSSEGHTSIGGLDIFYSILSADSVGNVSYGTPISLRMPINTPDDDEFYVPTANGLHAYFSSGREGGYGDQDIYVADLPNEIQTDPLVLLSGAITFNGTHERPEKVEINVIDVASGVVVSQAKPNAITGKYIILLNPGPLGKKYSIKYEAPGFRSITKTINVLPGSAYQVIEHAIELQFINLGDKSSGTISLGGIIVNENGESIVDVQVIVKDNNTGELIDTYTTSSDVGYYYITLEHGRNYNISFEAPGYLFQSQNIDIPNKTDHVEIIKNIKLEHIQKGVKMVLNNIFFDPNKATLRNQSMLELETVLKLLMANPSLVIEISGHTDSQGKDAANNKLSLERAKAVVNFLTGKGVPATQLIPKGYGKTQPVAPNLLKNGKPDREGMQKNRRVEMKVLESK